MLSDAPSSVSGMADHEAVFFGSVATPSSLSAVFQPIVCLKTGTVFAYEALVRCRSAGMDPTSLFKRASSCRVTGRLGRMIREIAIPLCSGIPLFVNLHPNELAESWLVRPDDPVFFHDCDLYLEITESAPLTHFELCMSVLHEICSRGGLHLVIDDFGAGYSNLKIIADLQPKVVKLDRQLIEGLHERPRHQIVVATMVRLCHELGAMVVAEGIETGDELSAVVDAGADYGQGFLLARPAFPPPSVTWRPLS
jgi:EAL domain-containing protein (putative c-di-GMP-specific phosphodiesterase class I)